MTDDMPPTVFKPVIWNTQALRDALPPTPSSTQAPITSDQTLALWNAPAPITSDQTLALWNAPAPVNCAPSLSILDQTLRMWEEVVKFAPQLGELNQKMIHFIRDESFKLLKKSEKSKHDRPAYLAGNGFKAKCEFSKRQEDYFASFNQALNGVLAPALVEIDQLDERNLQIVKKIIDQKLEVLKANEAVIEANLIWKASQMIHETKTSMEKGENDQQLRLRIGAIMSP